MGIHIRGLVVFFLVMLPNAVFFLFPPRHAVQAANNLPGFVGVMELIGRAACFALPVVFGKMIAQAKPGLLVYAMAVCLFGYYACWARYFLGGREYFDLFRPLLCLPVPMAVLPALFFVLLGVWVKSPVFFVPALLFASGHVAVSLELYAKLKG